MLENPDALNQTVGDTPCPGPRSRLRTALPSIFPTTRTGGSRVVSARDSDRFP